MMLGEDVRERCTQYKALCAQALDKQAIEQIRRATNKCMVVGSDQFRQKIEVLTGRRTVEKKRGKTGWVAEIVTSKKVKNGR